MFALLLGENSQIRREVERERERERERENERFCNEFNAKQRSIEFKTNCALKRIGNKEQLPDPTGKTRCNF